jgi:hypothetical protein
MSLIGSRNYVHSSSLLSRIYEELNKSELHVKQQKHINATFNKLIKHACYLSNRPNTNLNYSAKFQITNESEQVLTYYLYETRELITSCVSQDPYQVNLQNPSSPSTFGLIKFNSYEHFVRNLIEINKQYCLHLSPSLVGGGVLNLRMKGVPFFKFWADETELMLKLDLLEKKERNGSIIILTRIQSNQESPFESELLFQRTPSTLIAK